MAPETFERHRLSVREDEILAAAIEGMTDIQIAQRLEISQSTVNSYWVRIRGKLGQLSRTELVALALKQVARDAHAASAAEIAELRANAQAYTRASQGYEKAEIFRAALDFMPEAILVACQAGLIRYANARLEAMFGYSQGEMIDQPVSILVPPTLSEEATRLQGLWGDPKPLRLGLGNVLYGRRKNGLQIRVLMLLDGSVVENAPLTICVVRDFISEIGVRSDFHRVGSDPAGSPSVG